MDTKALRQKILDLAIRGKLVPQDPNDEPASVLLEKIRAEKQQMVKDGRLKAKDIKNDTIIFKGEDNLHYEKFQDGSVKCIEDEIPFEVPEGWEWCRLTEITFEIFAGGDKPENYSKTQTDEFSIPIFANGAENDGLYGFTNKARVNKSAITVSARGTIGFCCIRHMPFVPIVRLITIVPTNGINIEYLRIVFQALIETGEGSSIPQLTVPGIKPKLIPIPPYSEQTRISNKLIETEKIVSAVELNQESVVNYIKLAKSKILDLAIRGQLVPQDPNDEPASVLLERIRAEKEELIKAGKIKRDKKESIIFKGDDNSYYEKIGDKIRCIDAEIPFDLPELWTFARLKHIGGIVGGGTPKTNISKYWDGNIPWLTPADLSGYDSMYISTGSRTITDFGLKSSSAQMLPANSILYSSRAPIGYTAIATIPVCTNQGFKSVVPYDFSMSPYLYYCLRARTDNIIQRATGTTFKEISGSEMAETIIPIPPLNEQSKIIEKVTQLQEVISLIEKSLN
jgi:type I restriction enzyme S subunit